MVVARKQPRNLVTSTVVPRRGDADNNSSVE
jgi:hypothetical protein